jgi:tight adherence protein B
VTLDRASGVDGDSTDLHSADFDTVAAIVQRLAVLLSAGIIPSAAWRYAAADSRSGVAAAVVQHGVSGGGSDSELADHVLRAAAEAPAAERVAWGALAAAWRVAVESGAPLGPTLQRFAESLRTLSETLRDIDVALAGPRATSRIVLALPAVGLLFGVLLGFDAPRILATTPPGWACLVLGGALVTAGVRWNRALLRRARETETAPGLALELLAIGVSGGFSIDRARRIVDEALRDSGLPPLDEAADAVLSFAQSAGVPAAALLLAEAQELRRRTRSDARRRAAALGTRLLLPLGICILPAFVVLGVAPVVMSIVSGVLSTGAW